jgi:thioredoxin-dependent peroxiredoxin
MPLIDIGQPAPEFTLKDQNGKKHSLADFRGRPLLLYFYPKDDTPGCTAQACDFRDLRPRFEMLGVPVLGVSPDDEQSHGDFARKYQLPFPLLADIAGPDGTPPVCDRYGVWQEKSMYGRTYMGVQRTTYLIDAEGRIAGRWDKVKVPGHVEEVLAAAGRSAGTTQP